MSETDIPGNDAFGVVPPSHADRRGVFALVLVRHGESVWNREHRFTGWTDVDLTAQGEQEVRRAGEMLRQEKWEFDLAFTSVLKRCIRSQWLMLEALDQTWLPVFTDWRLNERHYGDLTGHTHAEVIAMHGAQRVLEWRRSFRARPLPLPIDDPRDPTGDRRYKCVLSTRLPRTESLGDTTVRVREFWEEMLKPSIRSGMRILVCAHGNSLRAFVKVLDSIPDAEIAHLDIPNGVPLVYWFDADILPLGRCFLDCRILQSPTSFNPAVLPPDGVKTMTSQPQIAVLIADEVLDSRGNPTIEVTVTLDDGTFGQTTVPSGASTGEFEAVELRDGDASRYGGKGVLKAVANVNGEIANALKGLDALDQRRIDDTLIELDGTESKSRLGANAILGASLACARAAAQSQRLALFQYLGGADAHVLPVPMFNVLNGGKHAANGPDVQEFKLVPLGAPTFREAYRYGAETYHALRTVLSEMGVSTNVGDEGGFVPQLDSNIAAMDAIMRAIERAGYRPGEDISIGLDPAASSFYENGAYHLARDKLTLATREMIDYWESWAAAYPLVSLEDPLADSDWSGFATITKELGDKVQIVGDDLFVTNRKFLKRGIEEGCCNSILIKLNQIGTVTETMDTAQMAFGAGYTCLVSHRSGETPDTSIADLAVALNCGQIKSGAPARGERVAKYNRLLEIEKMLGDDAMFAGAKAFAHPR